MCTVGLLDSATIYCSARDGTSIIEHVTLYSGDEHDGWQITGQRWSELDSDNEDVTQALADYADGAGDEDNSDSNRVGNCDRALHQHDVD